MRDKHYKNRTIRLADETWAIFKNLRLGSGLSWNLYVKQIIGKRAVQKQKSGQNRTPLENEKQQNATHLLDVRASNKGSYTEKRHEMTQ